MKKNSSRPSLVMICCYFVTRVIAVVVGYKGLGIVVVHRDSLVAVVVHRDLLVVEVVHRDSLVAVVARKDWVVADNQHRVLAETRQGWTGIVSGRAAAGLAAADMVAELVVVGKGTGVFQIQVYPCMRV